MEHKPNKSVKSYTYVICSNQFEHQDAFFDLNDYDSRLKYT